MADPDRERPTDDAPTGSGTDRDHTTDRDHDRDTEGRSDDRDDDERDDAHLADVDPGAGCTEIWEHLSETRDD